MPHHQVHSTHIHSTPMMLPTASEASISPSSSGHLRLASASDYGKKKRVGKACDTCRIKKTKCNGKKPCDKCLQDNRICTFSERRRDKEKHYPAGYIELIETRNQLLTKSLQKLVTLSIQDVNMKQFFLDRCPVVLKDPVSGNSVISINKVIDALVHQGLLQGEPVEWEEGIKIAADFDPSNVNKAINAFAKHSTSPSGSVSPENRPLVETHRISGSAPKPASSSTAPNLNTANIAIKKENLSVLSPIKNLPKPVPTDDQTDEVKIEDGEFDFAMPLTESNTFTSLSPSSSNSEQSIPLLFQSSENNVKTIADEFGLLALSPSGTNPALYPFIDNLANGTGSKIMSAALTGGFSMSTFENSSTASDSNQNNSLFSGNSLNQSQSSFRSATNMSNSENNSNITNVSNGNTCLFFDDKKRKPSLDVDLDTIGTDNDNDTWRFGNNDKPLSPVDALNDFNGLAHGSAATNLVSHGSNNVETPPAATYVLSRNLTNELLSPISSPVLSSPVLANAIPNDFSLASPSSSHRNNGRPPSPPGSHSLLRKTSSGHVSKPIHHYHGSHMHPHQLNSSHSHGLAHGHNHSHHMLPSKLPSSFLKLSNIKKTSSLGNGRSFSDDSMLFNNVDSKEPTTMPDTLNSEELKRMSADFLALNNTDNDYKNLNMFDDFKNDNDFTKTANEIINFDQF